MSTRVALHYYLARHSDGLKLFRHSLHMRCSLTKRSPFQSIAPSALLQPSNKPSIKAYIPMTGHSQPLPYCGADADMTRTGTRLGAKFAYDNLGAVLPIETRETEGGPIRTIQCARATIVESIT
jgi:hypothetical protein